nr:hypothetical protein [Actinomadura sp. HBU206391]
MPFCVAERKSNSPTSGLLGREIGALIFFLVIVGFLYVLVLLMRWFCFAVDRAVVEAFGRPVVDVAVEFERRNPLKRFNAFRVISPSAAQRVARLDRVQPRALP